MDNDSTERIVSGLRKWIATAPPGAQLPSNRALVAEYAASPVTVAKAMRALRNLGLVESRPGVGTFVRAVRTARLPDYGWQTAALRSPQARIPALSTPLRSVAPDVIALHSGYPVRELLPQRLVRTALARAARGDDALRPAVAAGQPDLQAWFARELAETFTVGVTPPTARDVVVLPGSQSGLSSIFRALVGFGQPMLIESPSYWGAILAAAQCGVRLVPVPSGPRGPEPEELSRAFAETGARVFYAQPNFANPTGAQWVPELAEQVLEVVRSHGAFLIEDDWAHDFAIDSTARPVAASDDAGHVIYLRSLTKSVSPSIRVAAMVARGPARDRILADRTAESMYVSGLLQAAALDVVTQPAWRTHLRDLRQQLQARRDLLIAALAEHAPGAQLTHVPRGGLHLWLRLPDATNLQQLVRECEAESVLVAPGNEWFPAEPSGPHLRLNFCGPDPQRFAEGARVIGQALARQLG
ncbi:MULTISPECIES: PLP-dependent aminotransferase family protein [unclassified Mycolicibacterium]|uniref:aminotransferase-like domain-containing protein n=1 Tax=unclassified Mycolicibacterium TaxID=2636767 RepID=UPI0012DDD3FD|nr:MULTISPECIES: PLP-dependent aminotransferase family protein [unclassified Mycolicibacterium]MUL82593.1 PLP-dependent aminotransferase family protein [Mycolicibacterium sp. CBMA 329]MUL88928.1 PLP-dependent aminotransferase family protein [Mycolicibacterium sp. CBMA 331]MUL97496.1 PLP-dependent aminotransferase family protein [Mycolicibacterium sp. CBMA 334]MUM26779.1 PLP-dependent aminotransferase family protein [Mycolicibacterium sp. CBMA 295]MUM38444.1 PLP-dependent aminotransferase famil